MIRDMRDSVSSWPMRIGLIVLIVSFGGIFGLNRSQRRGGLSEGEVAKVNGEPITARDFTFRYQNLIQGYQRQGRLPAEVPESIYNMLKQQLLNSMIFQKLKADEAKKLHLLASNEKVKETIKNQFSGSDGKFDFKFYQDFLRNQLGKSPGQFEEEERESLRADLFEQFILETGLSSNLQLEQSYNQRNHKVVLSYVKFNEKTVNQYQQQIKAPSNDELKQFYDAHLDQFKTKEKKKLDITFFEKKDFSASKDFMKEAEDLLRATQDSKPDPRLQKIETNYISYDDHVSSLSATEVTEILNATVNLDVEKNTLLVARDGAKIYLITLKGIQPAKAMEFASIKNDVQKAYMEEKSKAAYDIWLHQSWEKITAGTQSLQAFAAANHLTVKDTEAFEFSANNQIPGIGMNEEIMSKAFSLTSEKPYLSGPVTMEKDVILVMLKKDIAPDWKKFETEKENLANVLHSETAQSRFSNWMEAIEKKANIKRELQVSQSDTPFAE